MRSRLSRGLLLACICAALVPALAAQDAAGKEGTPERAPAGWSVRVTPRSGYVFGGQLDGPSDRVDVWTSRLDAAVEGPLWRGARLTTGAFFEHRHYEFHGTNSFLAGTNDPLDDVETLGLSATLLQGLSSNLGAFLRVGAQASGERGADLGDAVSWNALAGLGYRFSDDFQAGVGLLVYQRFERSVLVLPAAQLRWRIAEDWTFRIEGPGAELSYGIDDRWEVALAARVESRRFRLDGGAPGFEGIVQDTRIPLFLRVGFEPSESARIELEAGVDVFRQFDVEDRDGHGRRTFQSGAGPFVSAALVLRF